MCSFPSLLYNRSLSNFGYRWSTRHDSLQHCKSSTAFTRASPPDYSELLLQTITTILTSAIPWCRCLQKKWCDETAPSSRCYNYRKIPTQRPPPSKRPPPFSAPKVLQRGHISSCNRPERLFLGTCRLTLYEKCSVMVTFLFHQFHYTKKNLKLPSNRPPPS